MITIEIKSNRPGEGKTNMAKLIHQMLMIRRPGFKVVVHDGPERRPAPEGTEIYIKVEQA